MVFTFLEREYNTLFLRAFDDSTGILYELQERPEPHHFVLSIRSIHGLKDQDFKLKGGAALDFWARRFDARSGATDNFFATNWNPKWSKILDKYYTAQATVGSSAIKLNPRIKSLKG